MRPRHPIVASVVAREITWRARAELAGAAAGRALPADQWPTGRAPLRRLREPAPAELRSRVTRDLRAPDRSTRG